LDAEFAAEKGIHGVYLAREEGLKVCRAYLHHTGRPRQAGYKLIRGPRLINHHLLAPKMQPNPYANGRRCSPLSQKLQNFVKGSAISRSRLSCRQRIPTVVYENLSQNLPHDFRRTPSNREYTHIPIRLHHPIILPAKHMKALIGSFIG